jgi:ribonuclease BN (tRNA processing enzyme)
MSRTKLVLLGTGTPIMAPGRYQSSLAIIVDDQPYIVDCGSGILQRLADARAKGITALANENLTRLFLTHFHPDHTLGLPGFLIAPWNMNRRDSIEIYGPKDTDKLINGLLSVYKDGINEHLLHGPKPLSPIQTKVSEIKAGVFYQDEKISVESIPVVHGTFEAYAFKFTTPDKTIVVSGDTCPVPILYEKAKNCDILVHEVFCESAMEEMPQKYRDYFYKVHTGALELGKIAKEVNPKLLVLTHQIFYNKSKDDIIKEIRENYDGPLAYGNDLDVFT